MNEDAKIVRAVCATVYLTLGAIVAAACVARWWPL